MPSSYISTPLAGEFHDQGGEHLGHVAIEMSWATQDPYAFGMLFDTNGVETSWTVSAELFARASHSSDGQYHGQGDIAVSFDDSACFMLIHPHSNETALVICNAEPMKDFIKRAAELWTENADEIRRLVDAELDALLEAA